MSAGYFTTADGCVLAFEDVGSGLPVVWQHGLTADRRQPAEVFPASSQLRRITLECRAHGRSQMGDPSRLSIKQFAMDVAALLDHLGLESVVAGGISLGAAVSMRLAATLPHRVRGLILARPAWVDESAPLSMRPYLLVAELLRQFGPEKGLRQFGESALLAEVERVSPDNAASLRSLFSREDAEGTVELLSRLPKDGVGLSRGDLAAFRMPTLVIGNAEDYVHPLRYAEQLREWIADATLRVVTSKTLDKELHQVEVRRALVDFLSSTVAVS